MERFRDISSEHRQCIPVYLNRIFAFREQGNLFCLRYCCGLRISEARTLKNEDIALMDLYESSDCWNIPFFQ